MVSYNQKYFEKWHVNMKEILAISQLMAQQFPKPLDSFSCILEEASIKKIVWEDIVLLLNRFHEALPQASKEEIQALLSLLISGRDSLVCSEEIRQQFSETSRDVVEPLAEQVEKMLEYSSDPRFILQTEKTELQAEKNKTAVSAKTLEELKNDSAVFKVLYHRLVTTVIRQWDKVPYTKPAPKTLAATALQPAPSSTASRLISIVPEDLLIHAQALEMLKQDLFDWLKQPFCNYSDPLIELITACFNTELPVVGVAENQIQYGLPLWTAERFDSLRSYLYRNPMLKQATETMLSQPLASGESHYSPLVNSVVSFFEHTNLAPADYRVPEPGAPEMPNPAIEFIVTLLSQTTLTHLRWAIDNGYVTLHDVEMMHDHLKMPRNACFTFLDSLLSSLNYLFERNSFAFSALLTLSPKHLGDLKRGMAALSDPQTKNSQPAFVGCIMMVNYILYPTPYQDIPIIIWHRYTADQIYQGLSENDKQSAQVYHEFNLYSLAWYVLTPETRPLFELSDQERERIALRAIHEQSQLIMVAQILPLYIDFLIAQNRRPEVSTQYELFKNKMEQLQKEASREHEGIVTSLRDKMKAFEALLRPQEMAAFRTATVLEKSKRKSAHLEAEAEECVGPH